METDKVRETQLRRMLSRHGRRLAKSRRRLTAAPGCRVYLVVDIYNHTAERIPPYIKELIATENDAIKDKKTEYEQAMKFVTVNVYQTAHVTAELVEKPFCGSTFTARAHSVFAASNCSSVKSTRQRRLCARETTPTWCPATWTWTAWMSCLVCVRRGGSRRLWRGW